MNKKILIGSLLVLTLLLLMPSIPAIQQNIVKDKIEDKIFSEIPEDLDFKDIKELIDIEQFQEISKYFPLLYLFVVGVTYFRLARVLFLLFYSLENGEINHWLLFIRAGFLYFTIEWWCIFWGAFSDKLGLNWNW